MKRIDEDIKTGKYSSVYLLYGEEDYLKKQYKDKLIKALVTENDTMNFAAFEGKGISIGEIIDLAETLPFLAERRVILISDSQVFKNKNDVLAEYMKNICESTSFIFVENEVDKRSKIYKSVKNSGTIVEFNRQEERILSQWILTRLKKENKKITQSVMYKFIETVGVEMYQIDKELEKLICYTMEKEVIESEDIDAVCIPQVTNKIFDMVNAIGEKDQTKSLSLYYDLLSLKEPPMRILFLIVRQFKILIQVKELYSKGYDSKYIASKVSMPPFAVKRHINQTRQFTMNQLMTAYKDCGRTEEAVKIGNMNDRMGVELLIVEYSKR